MRKLYQPMLDAVHKGYESLFFYNAPRARSKKVRKYEHIDVSREFEILTARREKLKQQRLEEIYEKHDEKMSKISDLQLNTPKQQNHMATFSDGEEAEFQRRNALQKQEAAEAAMIKEMQDERKALADEFANDDLSQTILVQGIHKVCVMGMLKYH